MPLMVSINIYLKDFFDENLLIAQETPLSIFCNGLSGKRISKKSGYMYI